MMIGHFHNDTKQWTTILSKGRVSIINILVIKQHLLEQQGFSGGGSANKKAMRAC